MECDSIKTKHAGYVKQIVIAPNICQCCICHQMPRVYSADCQACSSADRSPSPSPACVSILLI